MSGPAARGGEDGRHVRSELWFWTWALAALGVVLVPAWLWLRRIGEVTEVTNAIGMLFDNPRPLALPPTIARLLWFDVKLLPNAIATHGLAGLMLGSIVGLLQAAGVRGRAPLQSWVGQAALSWSAGSVIGFLIARSYVFAVHPEVLLDARGVEFFDRMFAPCSWGAAAGVLAATFAQLRRMTTARPVRVWRFLVWPVAAALFLHLGTVMVVASARRAELGEIWRQQSVEVMTVRMGWRVDRSWTAVKYEEACRERLPAACAAFAAVVAEGQIDSIETFDSDAERQQRVINLNMLACAGGSGAGCAALGDLYRTGRFIARSEIWADLFDQHACTLGARYACRRALQPTPPGAPPPPPALPVSN